VIFALNIVSCLSYAPRSFYRVTYVGILCVFQYRVKILQLETSMSENGNVSEEKERAPFEVCFLQDIHEILSGLETGRDIENLGNKLIELKEKIKQAKQDIEDAKGIDNTKAQQEAILKSLQQQLQIKKEIVEKHRYFQLDVVEKTS